MSAEELENMDYDKYVFGNDKYGQFIGNPAVGFHAIVFGLPKGGKSIWSMQFADYLANHFGKVLYIRWLILVTLYSDNQSNKVSFSK